MEETTVQLERAKAGRLVYTVDSFDNGIAFGQHRTDFDGDPRDYYHLKLDPQGELVPLRSRYTLRRENPLWELERYLMRLSRQGLLGAATIYFGTTTDPFHPFEGKFDASIKFLQLFDRYRPGLLVVQTRSPLVVIAMPVFKRLGNHAVITFGLETPDEESARHYTPGLPRVDERLKAINALRKFGIEVTLQTAPLLPYGDWVKDARNFATLLAENADYVYVRGLVNGKPENERKVKTTPLARKLAQDRKFHWLRPDSANPLISELEKICPQKLKFPERKQLLDRQLGIFAA